MSLTYYNVNIQDILEKLREFFAKQTDIEVVILFGSATRRSVVRDIDLLVHFRRGLSLWDVCKLSMMLEELLGVPVDLIPLDRAYPQVIIKAIQEGIPILVKNQTILVDAYKKALSEVMDIEIKARHRNLKQIL